MLHPQDVATMIGKYGCLALAYIRLFQMKTDLGDKLSPLALLVSCYDELIEKGAITESMYVQNPELLIEIIFGRKVAITKAARNETGELQTANNGQHFVLADPQGHIVWNSMDNNDDFYRLGIKDWRIMTLKEENNK